RLRHERTQAEGDHDRDDRHQQRDEAGDDRAEDEDENDQRGGEADLELAGLEVVLGEGVEVVVERALSRHRDAEPVAAVVALDDAEQAVDVSLTLHRDQRRLPVAQQAGDERPEARIVDRPPRRADDDQLVDRVLVRGKALPEELRRLLRLGLARHVPLRRQVPRQEDDGEADADDDRRDPGGERAPRMAARRARKSFGQAHRQEFRQLTQRREPPGVAARTTRESIRAAGRDTTEGGSMSTIRSTFDAWLDAFNAHDEQAIRALTADDCVFEGPGGVRLEGGDAVAGYAMVWLNAFSDAHLSAHQVVADGDWVAMTGTFKGTHDGTLASPDGDVPATGRTLEGRCS